MKASILEETNSIVKELWQTDVGDVVQVTDDRCYYGHILIILQPYNGVKTAFDLNGGGDWHLSANSRCPLLVRVLPRGTKVVLEVE